MFTKNKSPETSFYSNDETMEVLILKINNIQIEMRHQRADLATIKRQLHTLISDTATQTQVSDYYDRKTTLEDMAQDGNSSSS